MAEIATWPKLKTPEDGQRYVQDRVAEEVDYIKLMHESGAVMGQEFAMPSIELQKAVIDEAHKHNLTVVAHATCYQDTLDILEAGVDGLTHCFVDTVADDKIVAAYKKNNAHLNPTLATMGSGTTEGKAMQERFAHDPRAARLIGQEESERMCQCMGFMKAAGATQTNAFETVRRLKAEGVEILWYVRLDGHCVRWERLTTVQQWLGRRRSSCGYGLGPHCASRTQPLCERVRLHARGGAALGNFCTRKAFQLHRSWADQGGFAC